MKEKKNIFFIIILSIITFLISQILVYFISKENFLKSPMYVLLPIVGFFGTYFLTKYFLEFAKIKKLTFLIVFVVMGFFIYYFVLFIYYYQIYVVLNNVAFLKTLEILNKGFFKTLLDSAYLEFLFSAIIGLIFSKK
jgi:hypothetical protein